MARKTLVIALAKKLPKSAEVRTAMIVDGSTPHMIAPDLAGVLALEAGDDGDGGEDE